MAVADEGHEGGPTRAKTEKWLAIRLSGDLDSEGTRLGQDPGRHPEGEFSRCWQQSINIVWRIEDV